MLLGRTLLTIALCACALAAADPAKKEWRQLFNGKNLDGWTPKIRGYELGENYADTFRVRNGSMAVSYDKYDGPYANRFGHIFYKEPFSYYVIAAEYRFVGDQAKEGPGWAFKNSGIMIHCQDPKTMRKDQDFPDSIEVQLLGGKGSGERSTANLCTPGTNVEMGGKLFTTHCVNSKSPTFHGEEWVRVEVEVHGGEKIRHLVNGVEVISYEKPQLGGPANAAKKPTDGKILTEGWISLQSESHPIEFRKVEILNLAGCMDKKAKNYKSYYVHAENGTCKF